MSRHICARFLFVGLAAAVGLVARAESFTTPLNADDLDPAAFTQWVDGAEKPMEYEDGPRHVIWTKTTGDEPGGLSFADTKTTGIRHMRIGWKTALTVGTVIHNTLPV